MSKTVTITLTEEEARSVVAGGIGCVTTYKAAIEHVVAQAKAQLRDPLPDKFGAWVRDAEKFYRRDRDGRWTVHYLNGVPIGLRANDTEVEAVYTEVLFQGFDL